MTTHTTTQSLYLSFSSEDRQNMSPVGLRSLFRMEEPFTISDVEIGRMLGGISRSDIKEWRRAALAKEVITLQNEPFNRLRWSLLVFQGIGRNFPNSLDKGHEWLRKNNWAPTFGGRTPIALMMDVEAQYLAAAAQYANAKPLALDLKAAAPKAPKRKRR